MKNRGKLWAWFIMFLGVLYFFLPLVATFIFSLKARLGELSFQAYTNIFSSPSFYIISGHRLFGQCSRSLLES